MSSLMLRVRTVAFATVAVLLMACGGSSPTQVGGGTVTPPPPKDGVSFLSVLPSDGSQFTAEADAVPMAKVSFVVDVVSTLTGSPVTNISYALDGLSLATNLNVPVVVGKHTACATATTPTGVSAQKCWTVSVTAPAPLPRFTGRVEVIGGAPCPSGLNVYVGPKGSEDSGPVASDCTFSVQSKHALANEMHLSVPGTATTKGVVRYVLRNEYTSYVIRLVPAVWTIVGGVNANKQQSISLEAAYADAVAGGSFYYHSAQVDGSVQYRGLDAKNAPPTPVAFCQSLSDIQIPSGDSTVFWSLMSVLQKDHLALTVLRPANPAGICDDGSTSGKRLFLNMAKSLAIPGRPGVPYAWSNEFNGYSKFVPQTCFVIDFCVFHEMMHTLGFGHTDSWTSNMSYTLPSNNPTPTDVAYVQLMAATPNVLDIAAAHQWERVQKQLAEQRVSRID